MICHTHNFILYVVYITAHGACLAFGPSCRIVHVAKTLPQLAVLEMRGNELTGTRAPPHTRGAARSRPHRPPAQVSPCCVAVPLCPATHLTLCYTLALPHTLASRQPLPCATPWLVPPPCLALPLRVLELSGTALCSTKLTGHQLAEEPAASLRLVRVFVRALGGHAPRLVRLSLAGQLSVQ